VCLDSCLKFGDNSSWGLNGIHFDEAHFLGGIAKTEVLSAFRPHIFFDDQKLHLEPVASLVSAAQVVSSEICDALDPVKSKPLAEALHSRKSDEKAKFMQSCRRYRRAEFKNNAEEFEDWFRRHVEPLHATQRSELVEELAVSSRSRVRGEEKVATASANTRTAKLLAFLKALEIKYRTE